MLGLLPAGSPALVSIMASASACSLASLALSGGNAGNIRPNMPGSLWPDNASSSALVAWRPATPWPGVVLTALSVAVASSFAMVTAKVSAVVLLSAVLDFDAVFGLDAILDLGAVLSFNDMTSSYYRIEAPLPRYFGFVPVAHAGGL